MSPAARRPWWRSRWWMPAFCVALGAVVFAAFALGGEPGDGVRSFAVLAAVGAVFLLGSRSETLRGLGGPGRDERWQAIDLRASAVAGLAVIAVAIGAWLYELARGRDGGPYGQLLAVGGVTYVVAVLVLRRRS